MKWKNTKILTHNSKEYSFPLCMRIFECGLFGLGISSLLCDYTRLYIDRRFAARDIGHLGGHV